MELRTLRSFLVVAREENMTHAARLMHVSQPTLSRQMRALEDELGCQLFMRHSFSIELTESGRMLQARATEIVELADRIGAELSNPAADQGGELFLGMAESWQVRYVARVIRELKRERPQLTYHVTSGDTEQVAGRLDAGVDDFAVLAEPPNAEIYDSLELPDKDAWGVLLPLGHPLASLSKIRAEDLLGQPLLASEQGWRRAIRPWAGDLADKLSLEGTFRLAYNGSVFVREGLGVLLTLDGLAGTGPGSGLVFRPLEPRVEAAMYLIWRRNRQMSAPAARFLALMRLLPEGTHSAS